MSGQHAILPPESASALVIFSDDTHLWWLRPLKKGFRHCAVALTHGGNWLMVEPLSCGTSVQSLGVGADYDLKGWFECHGLTVVPTTVRTDPWMAPSPSGAVGLYPVPALPSPDLLSGIAENYFCIPFFRLIPLHENKEKNHNAFRRLSLMRT